MSLSKRPMLKCKNAPHCTNAVRTKRYCAACMRVLREMRAVLNTPRPRTGDEDREARRAIHVGRAAGFASVLQGVV